MDQKKAIINRHSFNPGLGFLGIGAQKCGTSWLYEQLARHPDLAFPAGKEVHYWDGTRSTDVNHYQELFMIEDGRLHGEITPAYGILDAPVIAECHRAFPKLKLLYIIRNPIERAWSAARMGLERAEMKLNEASDAWFIDHFRSSGSLRRGDYESCLRLWRGAYGEAAILVLRFEDILQRPQRLLNQCCLHLGVEPIYTLGDSDLFRFVNRGSSAVIRRSLRPVLIDLYRDKIHSLERYLQQDLTDWLIS